MMTEPRGNRSLQQLTVVFSRALLVAGFLFCATAAFAQLPPGFSGGTNNSPSYKPIGSWSFADSDNWTSDKGYAPVSFTNLDYSYLGNGHSLVVDSTNQAWLQFNVTEANGTNNLAVGAGSVTLWFAPSWSSVSAGGEGSGEFGRLLEVGKYTEDSSVGWWSLFVDDVGDNIYFTTQTNDYSSNVLACISTPISWTPDYFHFVVLTYSPTNTALYLDGGLVTNGLPLSAYPGANVLTNGFFIGSDSNGLNQAHGLFNNIRTYDAVLDPDTIQAIFNNEYMYLMMSPVNKAMFKLNSASANVSITPTPNIVTGQGNLQIVGAPSVCYYTTNPYTVWITNVTASTAANGTMNITFAIEGGQDGYYYDVFAGTILTSPLGNGPWWWQGQGPHCNIYTLTNLPQGTVFLILGTPQDTDLDGLTDAYENLVSKTDLNNPDTDGDGIPDGWEVLLGMNPLTNDNASYSSRANYTYDFADWLNQITGIKSGSITNDPEGNVLQVSQ